MVLNQRIKTLKIFVKKRNGRDSAWYTWLQYILKGKTIFKNGLEIMTQCSDV